MARVQIAPGEVKGSKVRVQVTPGELKAATKVRI